MIRNFPEFAAIVAATFQQFTTTTNIFTTNVPPESLYDKYQRAFPPDTNPIFKVRAEHDCSCCKNFIRRVGNVVVVTQDYKIRTIWDEAAQSAPAPYNVVAAKLRDKVLAAPIDSLFRVAMNESSFGMKTSRSQDPISQVVHTWDHFYTGEIPRALRSPTLGKTIGDFGTTVAVFKRGLDELNPGAAQTVLDLIDENSLYRGEEHKAALVAFQKAQKSYLALSPAERAVFVWAHAGDPAARFRNTVLGTLVTDLSAGMELEAAVASYEAKVAPGNYKRTTALITPVMVKSAMKVIEDLGLEPALERRLARIEDVSVRDVLWVDGDARPKMKGGLVDVLLSHAKLQSDAVALDVNSVTNITLGDFMTKVLPGATSLELLFRSQHMGNLMALTAPVHPEPAQLFRWNNDFAWSYGGNVADSYLRQKVQSLGGRVDGVLRFSHMWNHEKRNASLMDLHVFMPGSSDSDGVHDRYPSGQRVGWNRRSDHASGGVQDVDYTSPAPEGYIPVENITFPSFARLKDGQYVFKIHNWALRQPTQGGFRAEIEFGGQIFQYDHPAPLKNKEWITLAVATLKSGVFTIEHKHPVGIPSQTKWNLTTEQFVKVNTVTLSPNFWGDSAVGNKHIFFVLDGCKADEALRGIYNEFLHPRLEEHRKVFEVIGDKTKCQPTGEHMAGLGFSSTKKDAFVIRVRSGKTQRTYNVTIG